ncbi:hypothetical protein GCM10023215_16180 [Pseudonocardia yuanmonensis]|uniref:Uncharacterized protein n=1 Tax=Pseudonocardia yuanmonensis TaxID=1095914 RepID=A0ABP8W6H8_9PSEU
MSRWWAASTAHGAPPRRAGTSSANRASAQVIQPTEDRTCAQTASRRQVRAATPPRPADAPDDPPDDVPDDRAGGRAVAVVRERAGVEAGVEAGTHRVHRAATDRTSGPVPDPSRGFPDRYPRVGSGA